MAHAMKQLETDFVKDTGKNKCDWDDYEKRIFQDKIADMAMNNYYQRLFLCEEKHDWF
jgi:type I restriction enzyme M protein